MLATAAGAARPCSDQTFEDSHFTVCPYDSRHEALRLVWKDARGHALRGFKGISPHRVRFAMNAGMYQQDGTPLGFYVENGKRLRQLNLRDARSGNFYMKPNGVFSMKPNGAMRIEPSYEFALRSDTPQSATQSGPLLVLGGKLHPQITEDGPSRNLRNGVGLRDAHHAYFVISDDPVSFGKLARLFRDRLGCPDALYFDGAVSSAWIPSRHRMDNAAPLGPMVVVSDKK
ncbi:MAG TPA: phosphodiester glycosidase family protein [Rhizomicrobium sp.]